MRLRMSLYSLPEAASCNAATLAAIFAPSSADKPATCGFARAFAVAVRIDSASARFDQLTLGKILLRVFDGFLEHTLDLGIVDAVTGLDFDGMPFAGAQ